MLIVVCYFYTFTHVRKFFSKKVDSKYSVAHVIFLMIDLLAVLCQRVYLIEILSNNSRILVRIRSNEKEDRGRERESERKRER